MKQLFFASLFLLSAVYSMAQVPTQWRGQNRTGIYPETGLLKTWPAEGPKILWSFEGIGKGFASVVVSTDRIYTTGMLDSIGHVFAFDMSGKLLWKTPYGKEFTESWYGTRTTPTLVDGKLYIMSSFGLAACFDAQSGKELWRLDTQKEYGAVVLKWGITESPLVIGDKVIFTPGAPDVTLVALDKNSGKLIWKTKANGEISAYCSPLYVEHKGKKLILTHTQNNVICVNADNGEFMWQSPKTNQWSVQANTPTFIDGFIYVVSGYGSGSIMLKMADDCKSVSEVWKNSSLDNQMGGVIAMNGKIYGSGQNDKSWQCLDWATGAQKYQSKEIGKGCIIAADGLLYFYSDKGELALVKPGESAFEILGKTKVTLGTEAHWAHPVIHNGVLYLRHGNALIAYSVK
jgi:outer membrane protein assembly factor BamB